MQTLKIETWGVQMLLHPTGAVYWPAADSLLVADLHLGKESVFQQSGIAIPSGASSATLRALGSLVEEFSPKQVIVLGDLLHARVGLTPPLQEELLATVDRYSSSQWILIPGNHDRGSVRALRNCGWSIAPDRRELNGVALVHAPPDSPSIAKLSIAGHLHPSIRVALSSKEAIRLRCYWMSSSLLVLPAFGGWTGTKSITPASGDRVFACVDREVIELAR